MQATFLNFVNKHHLFDKESKILAGVSGGIDSVVLCDLLNKSEFTFGIVHCNFGLRGKESDEDELFARGLADRYNVPFFSKQFIINKKEGSVQQLARDLRYNYFNELITVEKYDCTAVAHHLNDSVETMILNLINGAGISGLRGIPVKNGDVVRPLSFATRKEIEAYACDNKLSFREDSSNVTDLYRRNFIRHRIVPLMKELNPNLENTLLRTFEKLSDTEELINQKIEKFQEEAVSESKKMISIDINKLKIEKGKTIILHELLKVYNFNYDQVKEIVAVLDGQPGKRFLSDTHELVKDRSRLIITPIEEVFDIHLHINKETEYLNAGGFALKTAIGSKNDFALEKSNDFAFLDADKLKFPLLVRPWRSGDEFTPLGMKTKKKISDFLIDKKIPLNLKKKIYVVQSGDEIVWVTGYGMSENFKIDNNSTSIFKMEKITG